MFKRRLISAGVIITLVAEIILGPVTVNATQFPLKKKSATAATTQLSVYNPLNDPIRKALEDTAIKVSAEPTLLPSVKQITNKFTNMASIQAKDNSSQFESVKFTDLIKTDSRRDKKEIIVKYKDVNKKDNTRRNLITKKNKLSFKSKYWSKKLKIETVEVSDESELTNVIDELKKDPNVEYAQPNYKLELMDLPSDERFIEEWALQNSGQTINGQAGTAGIDINAINAWNITKGSDTIKVAIIDSGVDINHPDLAGAIYKNPNEQDNDLDDDGNGYVNDINGWNFVDNTNNVYTSDAEDTHGTHIAGIIAAGMNNGGITGVASKVKIVPLKFISGNVGYTSDAISAIEYCQKIGVTIANLSWGGPNFNEALKDAMSNSSILFVVAAGNAGRSIDTNSVYPAAFDLPNMITVASNDNKGQLSAFSNFGSKVHIAAPGSSILSTLPGNKYGYLSGTSMAAPFVTGVACLLKSYDGSLSASKIKDRILNNTTKSANLSGKVSTSGRLNAHAALINIAPRDEITPLPSGTPTPQIPTDKSKEPQNIYDASLSGTGKEEKPLSMENNLFIDALINKGVSNTSSENGIENLSINKMKGNFVSVSWTTDIDTNSELLYGTTNSLEKKISYPEFTKKHQITLKVDNIDSIRFYKVSSTSKDGRVFESSIKESTNIYDLGGEPIQPVSVSETVYDTTAQDVNTLSYVMDNGSNHSLVTAQLISECTVFGTANGTTHDFYAVNLTAGKTYSISLKGMAVGEDYDISLLDNVLNYVGYSVNGSNYDENISFTAAITGPYYIDVQPSTYSTSSTHHNYQLMVYSTENAPDSYEPNDNKETAKVISDSTVITPTVNINTDEDWFVLNTTKTGKFAVAMKSIPSGCDYDMQVYDINGTLLGGSYSSGSQDEKFDGIITTTGKYYVRVYSYTGSNATDTYELRAGVYIPDQYEANDDIYNVNSQNKPMISLNSCISGTIDNQDDIDYYKFTLNSSANISVRLQNIPYGMDYDVVVYTYTNGDFTEVGRSTVGGNADEAVINQLPAGSYFIKVYSYWGSSENQSYRLSINDETMGIIKIDFDKTSANVDEIITATLKVDKINNLAGYQVNLKYDPQVLMPVDSSLLPYNYYTTPESGNTLTNKSYSPFSQAYNDLGKGLLTFGNCYMNMSAYKASGIAEASGNIAIIKFKVISENKIDIRFESSESMPGVASGVELYDWNGNVISTNVTVQQPPSINACLPVNSQSVHISSVEDNQGSAVIAFGTYKISGYVDPELGSTDKSGFKVSIDGTTLFTNTDNNGYFEFTSVTISGALKIVITKPNYLRREITDIQLSPGIVIGTQDKPVIMWAGDINQDGSINISDIIELAKSFNSTSGSAIYNANCDLNKDNSINMADVIIIAKRFGMTKYSSLKVITGEYIDIVAAGSWTAGLKGDGTVWNLKDQSQIIALSNVRAIYGSNAYMGWYNDVLALKEDGTIFSINSYGGTTRYTNLMGVKDISYNYWHTLFLMEDGSVYSLGANIYGQMGVGQTIGEIYVDPIKIEGLPEGKAIDVAAGDNHSLILMEDGTVWALGNNHSGQMGITDGFKDRSIIQTLADIPYKTDYENDNALYFDLTGYYTAGDNFEANGFDKYVQFFMYKTNRRTDVLIELNDTNYSMKIYYGKDSYKLLTGIMPADDNINIFIYNDILKPDETIPVNRYLSLNILVINNSNKTINAQLLRNNGTVNIIERNSIYTQPPVQVEGIDDVKAIFTGMGSSYALKNDGTLWAWGENSSCELGIDGLEEDICIPTQVENLSQVKNIVAGIFHNVALKDDGTVWAWGRNYCGTLGLYSYNSYTQNTPVQIKSLNGVVDIDIGGVHSAALKNDGSVWVWGLNDYNQTLGKSILGNRCYPERIAFDNSDARLSSINIIGGYMPPFNTEITEYTVALPSGTTNYPEIYANTVNPSAKYIVKPGVFPEALKIEVTSQDGITKKVYTINFTVNIGNSSTPNAPTEVLSTKGCIDFGGEVDIYKFTAPDNVAATKYTIYSEGDTDTVIEVYDSDFKLVASNDDSEWSRNFYLELNLVPKNAYHLMVSHFDTEVGTGDYTLKVINSVKVPLPDGYVYFDALIKGMNGVLSTQQVNQSYVYTVTIDGYTATFDSTKYKIDTFNGRVIIKLDDFANAFPGYFPDGYSNTDPTQTTMTVTEDSKFYKINQELKTGIRDKKPLYGNIFNIQRVLQWLGCGTKYSASGVEYLETTSVYDKDTVGAVAQFQREFMKPGTYQTEGIVDTSTANELTKYSLVGFKGGVSSIKVQGASVRVYLTQCLLYQENFKGIFEYENGILYYRVHRYAPRAQLHIDSLYYNSDKDDKRTYAKIKDMDYAVAMYNQEKSRLGTNQVTRVSVSPGEIKNSSVNWEQPYEFKNIINFTTKSGTLEPYADIIEIASCFNGWIGSPEATNEYICVAQFYNSDSALIKLYFDTKNRTVTDTRNKPVNIEFEPFSDPTAKNRLRANIVDIARYLGFYGIYSVVLKDGNLQLCIDASRVPKEKMKLSNIISMAVSCSPAGDAKDVQEVVTGVDLITGEKLTTADKVITVVCAFLPIISGKAVRVVKKGFIKEAAQASVEAFIKIKGFIKDSPERIFESVKSIQRNKDTYKIIDNATNAEITASRSQLKTELMIDDGLSEAQAEARLIFCETGCFSGETIIKTKAGPKRIDSIKEGEFVLAKDINTGTIDYKEVNTVYIKSTYEFVHLKMEDEDIRTTASHLFFTDSGWWKAAENLKVGDKILNSKGELKTLIGKSIEILNEPEKIYNLNVADFHTYFVGTNSLLVHNDCTADMMEAGREAIKYNRSLEVTDPQVLSRIGSYSSNLCGRLNISYEGLVAFEARTLGELQDFADNILDFYDGGIEHIFKGKVGKDIKTGSDILNGYHYEGFPDAVGRVKPGTESVENSFGVYKAEVESLTGVPKVSNGGISTFFPKDWTPKQVFDAILDAYYRRAYNPATGTYIGELPSGMKIELVLREDPGPGGATGPLLILSAYPVY